MQCSLFLGQPKDAVKVQWATRGASELHRITRGSFIIVVETPSSCYTGGDPFSSYVQAGLCLSAMYGRLVSRYNLGSTLISMGVHFLFAMHSVSC